VVKTVGSSNALVPLATVVGVALIAFVFPLYYLIAWLWVKVFGLGEFGLRSLSALIGTATVPLAFLAARELYSRRVGLAVAALASVSPILIWYSQEARAYALLTALSALSLWAFARLLREPSGRAAAVWALASAFALASHYFAAVLVFPEAIWLVAAPLPVKRIASHLALDPERPDDDQQRRIDRTSAETLTLLETLMSCAPVGFGFVDRDFRMLRLNERLAAVNGSTVADQLGRKVCDITPELWPTIEPAYRQVLATGEAIVNFEISGTSAESPGRTRHWLDSWYPVRIDDEIVGIGIVVVDVTERFEGRDRPDGTDARV